MNSSNFLKFSGKRTIFSIFSRVLLSAGVVFGSMVLFSVSSFAAAPTFVSAKAISDTSIEVVFSEAVQTLDHTKFSSGDFTVISGTLDTATVTLVTSSLGSTSFTSSDLDIAAAAVQDVSTSTPNVEGLDNAVSDGQKPIISEGTVVSTPTNAQTPTVILNIGEAGTFAFSGGCDTQTLATANAALSVVLDSDGAGADLAENTYSCSVTVEDAAGNISDSLALTSFKIDVTAPQVTASITETSSANATGDNGGVKYYQQNDTLQFTVVFDEEVNVTNVPELRFRTRNNLESALYLSGTGTDMFIFQYTVDEGVEKVNDWDGVRVEKFDFSGGSISDLSGNILTVVDFSDVTLSDIKIDSSAPAFDEIIYGSTSGFVHGAIRYLNAESTISADFSISEKDTRSAASVDIVLTGGTVTLTTGSSSTGEETTGSKTSSSTVFVGLNGTIALSNPSWTDEAGKSATGTPTYSIDVADVGVSSYVVDTTAPVITFDTDVAGTVTQSESVQISVTDTNADTSAYEYGFSADATCDVSDTYGTVFTSGTGFTITTETNNGSYICAKAIDLAGNISYLASANALDVDVTVPVFTSSAAVDAAENQTGVITALATDTNTLTYTKTGNGLDDAKFSLTAGGVLTFVAAPDFEAPTDLADTAGDNTYQVEVRATDAAGNTADQMITVTVTNVNLAPTDIALSATTIDENVADASVVGTLSGTDDNENNNTLTFALSCVAVGADDADFTITGTDLTINTSPNAEVKDSYAICVQVSDGSLSFDENVTITINDLNENPEITSNGGGDTGVISVEENQSAVTSVAYTDVDLPAQTISYTLSGDDAATFEITAGGILTFVSAPDFETPTDTGDTAANNTYVVTVTATDDGTGTLTDLQTLTVTVTDVNDAPEISSNGGAASANISVPENQVSVDTITATDTDLPDQDLEFSVSGGADAIKFSVVADTGVLTFVSSPDFETPLQAGATDNEYEVEITVTDNGTGLLTDTQTLVVTVDDVDEIPPFIVISDNKPETTLNIAGGDVTFTIQFTNGDGGSADAVTDFDVSDVVVTGGTPAASFASGTSGSDVYTLVVTPDTDFEGNITLNIAAEAATDLTENLSLEADEYIQIVDTKSPTLSSVAVANGTPNQLTAVFSEALTVTDELGMTITVVDASGFVLETKTISAVAGTGTDTLVYTLGTPFQAEQIIKLDYVSATGNIQDLAENPLLDITDESVPNNIAEGSAILSDITLAADATTPSSQANVSWNTQENVNGVGTGTLITTDNTVEYGTTSALGETESLSDGSSHSATLSGLTANTVYYYRVNSVANGKTSTSQIFSFTTSRTDTDLHTDSTSLIQSFAEYNATTPYSSGWHFQFDVTVDNASENSLQFLFDNWVSGENAFVTEGNVKMIVSSTGTSSTEAEITAGSSVSTSYAGGDTVDISGIADGNPNIAGKQLVLDLYIKIPEGQAGGSYSTSYGIKTF